MARRTYEPWSPTPDTRAVIRQAATICEDYQAQGYDLTVRQLYYQFVARDLIPNNERSYQRLISIVSKARMAGLLDWDHIVDRTRNLRKLSHWDHPGSVIHSAAASYNRDLWAEQPERVEVWVEKEALAGVVQRAAQAWDCAWFSCRGYVSLSEMWAASQRILRHVNNGQRVTILHLGDHDPSGIDMTRDITDRMATFVAIDWGKAHRSELAHLGEHYTVHDVLMVLAERLGGLPLTIDRIALNRDQVDAYQPPPNPAKLSDSRAAGYIEAHGTSSWELDALDPATLDALIQDKINEHVEPEAYFAERERTERHRTQLQAIADRWDEVVDWHEQTEPGQ